ncbi:hypothetical protein G6F50_013687 [Rhizopus delemar]|uniref:Uncharacterized protein n=1 Tax=Rhizopus delemar TaxID=936053 RepID=A0A9P6YE28_9FUNG|nr:hypothetical protein G6F50_013687 [Rhizopus delemar]
MPTHTRTPVVASRLSAEVVQFTVMLSVPVVAPGALLLTLPNGSVGSAMAVQTATARAGVAASSPATSSRPSSSILMAPPPGCSAAPALAAAGGDVQHAAGGHILEVEQAVITNGRLAAIGQLHFAADLQWLAVHAQQGQAQRGPRSQLERDPGARALARRHPVLDAVGAHVLGQVEGVDRDPVALPRQQRADQQQAATGITQRPVHLPGLIGEHPVAQQALGHPLQLGLGIAGLHADQRQQAGADLPDRFVVDMHGGLADTLDQDEHRGLPNEQGRPR